MFVDTVLALGALVFAAVTIGLWFWAYSPGKPAYGGRLPTWNATNRAMATGVLAPGADQALWETLLDRDKWMTVSTVALFVVVAANEANDAISESGWRAWLAAALGVLFLLLAGSMLRRLRTGAKLRSQL